MKTSPFLFLTAFSLLAILMDLGRDNVEEDDRHYKKGGNSFDSVCSSNCLETFAVNSHRSWSTLQCGRQFQLGKLRFSVSGTEFLLGFAVFRFWHAFCFLRFDFSIAVFCFVLTSFISRIIWCCRSVVISYLFIGRGAVFTWCIWEESTRSCGELLEILNCDLVHVCLCLRLRWFAFGSDSSFPIKQRDGEANFDRVYLLVVSFYNTFYNEPLSDGSLSS